MPQDEFLNQQVARIDWSLERVPAELDAECHAERNRDPLDEFEVDVTVCAFEPTNDEPSDAGAHRESLLRPATALSRRSNARAEINALTARPHLGLNGKFGPPGPPGA